MLNKLKNKPLWHLIWASTVAFCVLYFLTKLLFFTVQPFDRLLQAYALISIVIDYLVFQRKAK